MVAQRLDEFLTEEFLLEAERALREDGFISDEHDFAPYRETISEHWSAIADALQKQGKPFDLLPGYINHPQAGYAYFIYDRERFGDRDAANLAVGRWLDCKYEANA